MEQVVKDAIRINLDELCFTEHVDYGVKPDWSNPAGARFEDGHPVTNCPYPAYLDELDLMRGRYGNKIRVARGLELGVQTHTIPAYERLLERYGDRLDFTLLSIHQVGDREFWNGAFQEGRTQEEFTMAYYEELLSVVEKFHGYSVVAHLDLIRRYDPTPEGPLPFSAVRDIVAKILSRVIADGKGIEVNTSGWRYGLDGPQPTDDVLLLYRDLGGKIITLGSDSHKPEHLGAYLRVAQDRLRALGFSQACTYEQGEPKFYEL
jgi:histidinol-phosphatase (PHP family)